MNPFSFLQEVREELSRVVWPTRRQALELTVLVIFVSLLVGIYIGGLDFIFTSLMNKILR